MAPLPDLIISSIKEILDSTENSEDKITRHNNVQNSLLELFKGLEYNAIKEFPIKYDRKYRTKARFGEPNPKKNGYIDFYAECKDYKVAVEYENGGSLKWKSIEKLLQSDALFCFGMVYGPKNEDKFSYRKKNLMRIQQVYRELISHYDASKQFDRLFQLLKKNFWLGIHRLDVFEKLNLRDLLKEQKYSSKGKSF